MRKWDFDEIILIGLCIVIGEISNLYLDFFYFVNLEGIRRVFGVVVLVICF